MIKVVMQDTNLLFNFLRSTSRSGDYITPSQQGYYSPGNRCISRQSAFLPEVFACVVIPVQAEIHRPTRIIIRLILFPCPSRRLALRNLLFTFPVIIFPGLMCVPFLQARVGGRGISWFHNHLF
jgi:hypothetical protein